MEENKIVLFKSSNIMCAKYAHITQIGENGVFIEKMPKYAKNACLLINKQQCYF